MLTALDEHTPIQIVLEDDERFHAFDLQGWRSTRHEATRRVQNVAGDMVEVPPRICEMIDAQLPEAVTYRRRDFETNSMMRELCLRNGVHLPRQPMLATDSGGAPTAVFFPRAELCFFFLRKCATGFNGHKKG